MVLHVIAIDVSVLNHKTLTVEIVGIALHISELTELLGRLGENWPFELQMLCKLLRLEREVSN